MCKYIEITNGLVMGTIGNYTLMVRGKKKKSLVLVDSHEMNVCVAKDGEENKIILKVENFKFSFFFFMRIPLTRTPLIRSLEEDPIPCSSHHQSISL